MMITKKRSNRDKEVWLKRVKRHTLHGSFHILEWCLRISPAGLVNPYRRLSRARCCKIQKEKGGSQSHSETRLVPRHARTDSGEIIAFPMERDLRDVSRSLG